MGQISSRFAGSCGLWLRRGDRLMGRGGLREGWAAGAAAPLLWGGSRAGAAAPLPPSFLLCPSRGAPGSRCCPGGLQAAALAVTRGAAGAAQPPQRGQEETKSLSEVLGAPTSLGAVCFPSLLYVALLGCGAGPPPSRPPPPRPRVHFTGPRGRRGGDTRVPGRHRPRCRSEGEWGLCFGVFFYYFYFSEGEEMAPSLRGGDQRPSRWALSHPPVGWLDFFLT